MPSLECLAGGVALPFFINHGSASFYFLPSIMSNGVINEKSDEHLRRIQTAESVFLPISREAFEKLYLNPKSPTVSGDLRKKLGNPTPISLLGFLLASTPNACIVMGWRGAGGNGAAIMYEYPLSRLGRY
jgi:hypothetical protein